MKKFIVGVSTRKMGAICAFSNSLVEVETEANDEQEARHKVIDVCSKAGLEVQRCLSMEVLQ